MKLLLYCTKAKPYLYKSLIIYNLLKDNKYFVCNKIYSKENPMLNGKIVAECDFEIKEIVPLNWNSVVQEWFPDDVVKKGCLTIQELYDYLNVNNGYAIYIKNLHIFNEPQWLMDLFVKKRTNNVEVDDIVLNGVLYAPVRKAPQNMMIVYDRYGNKYVLISIQPKWLCKILNGEKTIEVRKKVLKEMVDK